MPASGLWAIKPGKAVGQIPGIQEKKELKG
jgi:hypothetical protein